MTLDGVVPWGRSLAEYRQMFALTDADLAGHDFACGDGPASGRPAYSSASLEGEEGETLGPAAAGASGFGVSGLRSGRFRFRPGTCLKQTEAQQHVKEAVRYRRLELVGSGQTMAHAVADVSPSLVGQEDAEVARHIGPEGLLRSFVPE